MNFFGPNMQDLLRECSRMGIDWEFESPGRLRHRLNKITGQHISDSEEQEAAAAQWLMVMRTMHPPFKKGDVITGLPGQDGNSMTSVVVAVADRSSSEE